MGRGAGGLGLRQDGALTWRPRGQAESGGARPSDACREVAGPRGTRTRMHTAPLCSPAGGRQRGAPQRHTPGGKGTWPGHRPRGPSPAPLSTHPQPGQGQSQTAQTAGSQQQEAESTFQRGGPWAGRGLLTPQPTRPSSVTLFGDASRPRRAGAGFASCTYIQVSRANPVFTQCLLIRAWGLSHRVSQPRVHVCGRARSHTRSVGHAQNGKLRL